VYFLRQLIFISFIIILSSVLTPAFNAERSCAESTVDQTLHIAVASNFTTTLKTLAKSYEQSCAIKIVISSASTAKLTTQIRYGAPFDIFLSADTKHAQLLIQQNLAYKNSFYVYAQGQLALVHRNANAESAQKTLASGKIKQLAIANPKTAPYGTVAKNWLTEIGYSDDSFQYIIGENINQTWQFFQQGGTDAAVVALSQVLLSTASNYQHQALPLSTSQRLKQAVVILKNTTRKSAAEQFLLYLTSKKAVQIIQKAGYWGPKQ